MENEESEGSPPESTPLLSLYLACDSGDLGRVKELLDEHQDIDLNLPCAHGRRPLHMAARKGYTDICDVLLAHGADLEVRTIHGCTPLYFAVLSAQVEVVEVLADGYCANVNSVDVGDLSPLHIACEKGYADIVKCLLLLGADYTALDVRGRTPLDWAVIREHTECVDLIRPPSQDLAKSPSNAPSEDRDDNLSSGVVRTSSTIKNTQIALATRNEGKILKYPFTKENNTKPPPPYKIDIYDVY